jgi:RNA polymerase sigma factor (sigma-70 family)
MLQQEIKFFTATFHLGLLSNRPMNEERLLVSEVIQGNRQAFMKLIKQHERLVVHMIGRLIHNKEDIEDLCQEVFVKVYKKLPGFKFECKLSTWIATIAYREAINHLRKKKIYLEAELGEQEFIRSSSVEYETPEKILAEKSTSNLVQHYIDQLPVQYKAVLTLYHLDGMNYSEIVAITGMPEGTVKNYLFRARSLLKEKLKVHMIDENL